MENAYRKTGMEARGPLTFGEKLKAAIRGIRSFEPLLEIARAGLEPGLPRSERVRAAAGIGRSAPLGMIYSYMLEEKDACVKEALAYSFVESYRRTMDWYDNSLCSIYTTVGSAMVKEERDGVAREARMLALSLLARPAGLGQEALRALRSVADDRPRD